MKAYVLVLASIFFAPVALAQPVEKPPAEKIKILSWNIYMLPGIVGHANSQRAEAMGRLLSVSDYDVIIFQEAFSKTARKVISRYLQPAFPFQARPEDDGFSLRTNSGLWIVSRYPVIEAHSIRFDTRHGVDAMSKKGGLMVTLKIHSQLVQVVSTHLQNEGHEWRRYGQCVELYERLLKKYELPGVPQIVCGDFNIDMHASSVAYNLMLETIDVTNGPVGGPQQFSYDRLSNDLKIGKGKSRDLIDYILVRANQSTVYCSERKITALRKSWHFNHQDLSDHYSVEAEIYFKKSSEVYTVSLSPAGN